MSAQGDLFGTSPGTGPDTRPRTDAGTSPPPLCRFCDFQRLEDGACKHGLTLPGPMESCGSRTVNGHRTRRSHRDLDDRTGGQQA